MYVYRYDTLTWLKRDWILFIYIYIYIWQSDIESAKYKNKINNKTIVESNLNINNEYQ